MLRDPKTRRSRRAVAARNAPGPAWCGTGATSGGGGAALGQLWVNKGAVVDRGGRGWLAPRADIPSRWLLVSPDRGESVEGRRTMKRALLVTAVVLGVVQIAPVAHADDVECVESIVGETVDSVVVPPGAFCLLYTSNVRGNVDVGADATLLSACSQIGGNVSADGAFDVILTCTIVGGPRAGGPGRRRLRERLDHPR